MSMSPSCTSSFEYRDDNIHVTILGDTSSIAAKEILTVDALRFVGYLCNKFESKRQHLLSNRKIIAKSFDAGNVPTFVGSDKNANSDPDDIAIRDAISDPTWTCASIPCDVLDRRVEITGPIDRKMVINGLNSGACVYMADFEDSTSPTWNNIVEGQYNLRDAVNGTITYINPSNGKVYKLNDNKKKLSTLFVRPRGWHLNEAHVMVNGIPASGGIFDMAMYLFHNHVTLASIGTGPYFYLPKLEHYKEAALWNDVFVSAQQYLGLKIGTIRATVLIETITASYQMEEILYVLRDHMLGLNCGRWDYMFSYIKKLKYHVDKITPDRSFLTMKIPLMDSYVKRLIYICHKRKTFAMGGMSASIPIKNDPIANERAMNAVADDKLRECKAGHDGTWVAHPALVKVAMDVFDANMITKPNQIQSQPGIIGATIQEEDLLQLPTNIPSSTQTITSTHLSKGISIVLAYTEAWLRGIGCIPLNNAMEDAATAEISRVQIYQWRIHNIKTQDDHITITSHRISNIISKQVQEKIMNNANNATNNKWLLAGKLVDEMLTKDELDDFLTSVCYPYICNTTSHNNNNNSTNIQAKL